jgi:hypothetical protein
MSLHPISDKAEVSVDFPNKAYIGSLDGIRSSTRMRMTTASQSGWCDLGRIGARQ